MRPHDGRVDHREFVIGFGGHTLEDKPPDTTLGPAAETRMHNTEVAETFGKIAPRNIRAVAVEHGLHEQPVVRF